MRIYNATKAQIEMPLSNGTKLVISSNSVSGEFMPNATIISVFMTSYKTSDVAFIISGPYEITMLSNFAGSAAYVVNSVEEAVARFAPKEDPTTTAAPEIITTEAPKVEKTTTTTTTSKPEEVVNTTTTTTEEPKKSVTSSAPSVKKTVIKTDDSEKNA